MPEMLIRNNSTTNFTEKKITENQVVEKIKRERQNKVKFCL
jgi:hypothetical protein